MFINYAQALRSDSIETIDIPSILKNTVNHVFLTFNNISEHRPKILHLRSSTANTSPPQGNGATDDSSQKNYRIFR